MGCYSQWVWVRSRLIYYVWFPPAVWQVRWELVYVIYCDWTVCTLLELDFHYCPWFYSPPQMALNASPSSPKASWVTSTRSFLSYSISIRFTRGLRKCSYLLYIIYIHTYIYMYIYWSFIASIVIKLHGGFAFTCGKYTLHINCSYQAEGKLQCRVHIKPSPATLGVWSTVIQGQLRDYVEMWIHTSYSSYFHDTMCDFQLFQLQRNHTFCTIRVRVQQSILLELDEIQ